MDNLDLEKIKQDKTMEELIKFSILNMDKPSNCTSFDVVDRVRKLFGLEKCGHFGTLDPQVTGVLPICLEKACKVQEYFMHRDKIYIGKMKLHKKISKKQLETAMKKFIGKINQLPPRISRVKRIVREREVKKFKLIDYNKEKREASFIAEVQAGTYIRKLIDDLGKTLEIGAQMTELRRIKAGLFSEKDSEFTTIENIEEAFKEFKKGNESLLRKLLIPAEIITELLPVIEVKSEFIEKLYHGSPFFDEMPINLKKAKEIIKTNEPFGVIAENKLIEIAKFSDKFEQKSILAKAETVLK
jgi:H/ACA ribonucleoprotein complex subunit 4